MIICNFTDSYINTDFVKREDLRILDFSDLPESTGYCSDETARKIRERIGREDVRGERYIDDGNHHYLSKLWMEKIGEPFDLCVFDHHTDMQSPGLLPFLSCGSWIKDSMRELEMLENVYLIGIPEDTQLPDDADRKRVTVISEQEANSGKICFPAGKRPVYISVDLDVLSPDEFTSIWDQGSMTEKRLSEWLDAVKECRQVIAVDYCG